MESVPHKPRLLEEVKRGWLWVVFVFQVLRQMGGVKGILKAIWQSVAIPLRRAFRGK